jgi:hypothetical protein
MPHAQLRGCPDMSRLGRFRHSAAAMARAKAQYSEFKCLLPMSSGKPTIFR